MEEVKLKKPRPEQNVSIYSNIYIFCNYITTICNIIYIYIHTHLFALSTKMFPFIAVKFQVVPSPLPTYSS